jgi:hypothetical protein
VNITRAYALDISECGRAPNYFSTSALQWFCLYHTQQHAREGSVPCTSFATCKTFGDCRPNEDSASVVAVAADVAADAADLSSGVVSDHVHLQMSLGHLASPVMKLDRWMRDHVADDDALLPNLINRQHFE